MPEIVFTFISLPISLNIKLFLKCNYLNLSNKFMPQYNFDVCTSGFLKELIKCFKYIAFLGSVILMIMLAAFISFTFAIIILFKKISYSDLVSSYPSLAECNFWRQVSLVNFLGEFITKRKIDHTNLYRV